MRTACLDALAWQIELGADECIAETPIDRTALSDPPAGARQGTGARPAPGAGGDAPALPLPARGPETAPGTDPGTDPVAEAGAAARAARTLEDLRAAMAAYPHCELRRGARNLVFADGDPRARVMIVGEAPGREEDEQGRPFVGRAGRLLDAMFDAIGMARGAPDAQNALYITNVLPWRPPQNRDPRPEEIAMMRPFLERHIALAAPDILVAMGNHATHALLGRRGITRLHGQWGQAMGLPCLPMFHPAYLLRNPSAKRAAWADLLILRHRLHTP